MKKEYKVAIVMGVLFMIILGIHIALDHQCRNERKHIIHLRTGAHTKCGIGKDHYIYPHGLDGWRGTLTGDPEHVTCKNCDPSLR